MTLDEIAAITGGRLVHADPAAVVSGPVEYDSRKVTPDGLFVAFAGEKVDGHDFAATVGAPVLGTRDTGMPGVVVDDQLAALAKLARAVVDRLLVLEMGARGPGHIAYLTRIAPPRIGLVLNIGAAHLGEFGSVEGTARAKGELVEALPAAGAAVLNADDPLVTAMGS